MPSRSGGHCRLEPDRQDGFHRVVAGPVGELPGVGQAERRAFANADIKSRLDYAGISRDRQPLDREGLAASKGQLCRRRYIAEGMAPAKQPSRRQAKRVAQGKAA
nr:hypothetical protein [Phyllobacterium brassicacearum]